MSVGTRSTERSVTDDIRPCYDTTHAVVIQREAIPIRTAESTISSTPFAATARRPGYEVAKRVLDLLLAAAFIVLSLPLFIAIAIAIKLTSRGPVLFVQRRVGRNGRPFSCLKFRTMIVNAEQLLEKQPDLKRQLEMKGKVSNDPRLTKIGKFLRETSLDELPQFFNVLIGDLSLIGPRALLPSQLHHYGNYADQILTAKPGLGGIWQTSGRSSLSFEERVRMDRHYVEQRSIRMDVALLYQTAVAVLKRDGAK